MKALKKNNLGVSPVIAVILMVAITVVLAGVVFLWAQSFTDDAGGGVDTIVVDAEFEYSVDASGTPTTYAYTLYITPTTGEIDWAVYNLVFEGAALTGEPTGTTATGLTATFVVSTTDGDFTVGDEYNFKLVNVEDDNTAVNSDVLLKDA